METKEEGLEEEEESGKEFVRVDREGPRTRRFVEEHLDGTQTRMACRSDANIVPSRVAGVNDQPVPIFHQLMRNEGRAEKDGGRKMKTEDLAFDRLQLARQGFGEFGH